jgi:hypothetical protein
MAGHFKAAELFDAIHYLKLVRTNVRDMLKRLEEEIKANVRN